MEAIEPNNTQVFFLSLKTHFNHVHQFETSPYMHAFTLCCGFRTLHYGGQTFAYTPPPRNLPHQHTHAACLVQTVQFEASSPAPALCGDVISNHRLTGDRWSLCRSARCSACAVIHMMKKASRIKSDAEVKQRPRTGAHGRRVKYSPAADNTPC